MTRMCHDLNMFKYSRYVTKSYVTAFLVHYYKFAKVIKNGKINIIPNGGNEFGNDREL